MTDSKIITTRGLIKRFPAGDHEFTALNNIDINIKEGEFLGLVGPSGSGKTTLLNIIGALDNPTEGGVEVLGQRVEKFSHREAAKFRNSSLGFIFQSHNLLPLYTVYENIELPLLLLKIGAKKRKEMILEAIRSVGLEDKIGSTPPHLSGGECQRVAIARAVVKKPKLILADEPTANLDAENSHNILKIIKKLNRETGTTVIFATHDEKVIGYLERRVTLTDGRIKRDEKLGEKV